MLFLLIMIVITHLRTSECVKGSGRPVPHADVLDDILSKFLGDSYSNNALFDFILGEPNQTTSMTDSAGDNLDISVLDVHNVRKIIDFAKKKHQHGILAENTRRDDIRVPGPYKMTPRNEAYQWHPYIINKTIVLMKQAIYMTQEKVNHTRMYRKRYSNEVPYKVALLYGACAAMIGKMESLLNQMKQLIQRTHFIWFLILYEKILACNIDIGDTIEKIFEVQENFDRARGGRKKKSSRLNLTSDDLKELLQDPVKAELYFKEQGVTLLRRSGPTRVTFRNRMRGGY